MKEKNKICPGKCIRSLARRFFAVLGSLVLVLSALGAMLDGDNVMFCTQVLWIALFALLVALAFSVTDFLSAHHVGSVLVHATHFVLSYVSFLLTFVWGGGAESYLRSNTAFTTRIFMVICMSFLFIGVYAVCAVVRLIASHITHRRADKAKEYTPLYSDLTDEH